MPLQVIMAAAKTVSRASASVSEPTRRHQHDDERDLDDRHGDGEDERSERLAHTVRDDLGVVHRCEHGRREQERP